MAKNREVEVKLQVRDLEKLLADLKRLGAKKIARLYEHNTLFDTEDGRLRQRHAILRIRRERQARSGSKSNANRGKDAPTALLTFKGLLPGQTGAAGKYKEREEIECRIPDAPQFTRLLAGVGLCPWFQYEKYRTKYRTPAYPSLHIDLDETPIGVFLELEGPRRAIDRAARVLGYAVRDYITDSYLALYRAECSRKGVTPADMLFPTKKSC
jgi:adenylate cyclase, class 2